MQGAWPKAVVPTAGPARCPSGKQRQNHLWRNPARRPCRCNARRLTMDNQGRQKPKTYARPHVRTTLAPDVAAYAAAHDQAVWG